MTWKFNGDYEDYEQVAEFYPAFLRRYKEITAAGRYPYNASFKGYYIPGIEGPDEDTAIFLLQALRRLKELELRIEKFRADGFVDFDVSTLTDTPRQFDGVIHYYTDGSGILKWTDARLFRVGHEIYCLPKGKHTDRHLLLGGKILVKETHQTRRKGTDQ